MIYLIDDDKSVRRGFGMFLKSAGYDFRSIESSDDFMPLFKPVTGDLIVLDLSTPGIGGYDLLKKLDETGISIPVIVVTSLDDPHRRESCRKFGVKAFLRKPVDGEALIDIIKYNLAV
jgi:two-component system, LuxR family, response regulator FixJ